MPPFCNRKSGIKKIHYVHITVSTELIAENYK